MTSPYFDYNRMPPEPGDLVISGHVIRTGVDLMNVVIEHVGENHRVAGQCDELRNQVTEANVRAADHQVKATQAEAEARRLSERSAKLIEARDDAEARVESLFSAIQDLAVKYRDKADTSVVKRKVADDLDALILAADGGQS